MSHRGISVEIVHDEGDNIEVVLTADNGRFRCAVRMYVAPSDFKDAAENLVAFPANPKDAREFELGAFGGHRAGGAARLRFFCMDAAAHPAVEVTARREERIAGVIDTATIVVLTEAASIDTFIDQLMQMERGTSGRARLPAAL